jgi:hypothetical protein
VIRVADNGPGIPPEERDSIFSRGVRGSNAGTHSGNGLGLYIAAKLLRGQGGDLHVEDSETGGACFVVRLPGFSERATHGAFTEQSSHQGDQRGELVAPDDETILAFPGDRQRTARRIEDEDGVRDGLAR